MHKFPSTLFAAAFLAAAFSQPALADWREHGDIHHFHEAGFDHWRGGNWFHGGHGGRNGWWWIVDGAWYFYPAPIYPYPDPYTPPTVVVAGEAPGSSYYYCGNPAGYYPYVPECYVPWRRVAGGQQPVIVEQQPPAPVVMAPQPAPAPVVVLGTPEGDTQQLNVYSAAFSAINPADPAAPAKLKKLNAHVEAFRKSLYSRSYNAMGVEKNAEDLKHRISTERSQLLHHQVVIVPAPVPGQPPVMAAPPPGTPVTFPPQ